MKEKTLMTSFFAANWADIAITAYWQQHQGIEVGFVGSGLVPEHFPGAIVYRTATTVFLLGIYSLTQTHKSRWTFSGEKALKISNAVSWAVVAFNTLEMSPQFQRAVGNLLTSVLH